MVRASRTPMRAMPLAITVRSVAASSSAAWVSASRPLLSPYQIAPQHLFLYDDHVVGRKDSCLLVERALRGERVLIDRPPVIGRPGRERRRARGGQAGVDLARLEQLADLPARGVAPHPHARRER